MCNNMLYKNNRTYMLICMDNADEDERGGRPPTFSLEFLVPL